MNINNGLLFVLGLILFVFGIYLSVFEHEPHFYTSFSVGLLILSMLLYNKVCGKFVFKGWNFCKILIYFVLVLVVSVIIDNIGLALGYWNYPYYLSIFDTVLKYMFEWTIPLVSYMIIFMTGKNILSKLVFVLISGIITEYINSFVLSWQILKMPLLNYTFGAFNLVFVTIGYWLMAIITYAIYIFVEERVK